MYLNYQTIVRATRKCIRPRRPTNFRSFSRICRSTGAVVALSSYTAVVGFHCRLYTYHRLSLYHISNISLLFYHPNDLGIILYQNPLQNSKFTAPKYLPPWAQAPLNTTLNTMHDNYYQLLTKFLKTRYYIIM